jgi:HemY protein
MRTLAPLPSVTWSVLVGALALAGPDLPKVQIAAAAALASPNPGQARRLARRAWKQDPGFAPAALAYAKALRATGWPRRAAAVLRQSWAAAPHPDLAAAALDGQTTPIARLRAGQALIRNRPEDAQSHALMARLAHAADLPGEARRHIAAARAQGLDERQFWLLAAELGETPQARDEALHRAAAATDPVWACTRCGTTVSSWQPTCPHCGTVGHIVWRHPAAPAKTLPAN